MKKIIMTVAIALLAMHAFGQRECGSQLDLSRMQQTDPARYQRIMAFESLMQTRSQPLRTIPQTVITIPVVVHVVYGNSAQNISDAQMVQFDVSGLPNGSYFLHIYNGVDPKPEMIQILVQH